ncbi:MAG TPA: hypothetical protein VMZ69_11695 [Saprospiraceae bacterium]|nr:hypothetical protein [Saprospiraceae bacterium]
MIAGIISLFTFIACNNDDNDIDAETVLVGEWDGEYSFQSGPFNNFLSFDFKPGGVLDQLDQAGLKIGEGTWEFSNADTLILGTYILLPPVSDTFSFIANFEKEEENINGTWGYGQQQYAGGYFRIDKEN